MTKLAKHSAVTIVSKNYLSLAETVAASYLRHHPEHDFIVVLVDRADDYVGATLDCGAQVVEIGNFAIPDISRFIYRYSIMELNTAVKPFVLEDLFVRGGYETLLYIDPDIYVFKPFDHVYQALRTASIVLTPHMRRPVYDGAQPSDATIVQSGTYNLGFLGLRNDATARTLLSWWMTKLHKDCVVDIPNGLFVDQKWIDLVPGFFPDHKILYEPGYNVAYWNLHERPISERDGEWLAGGEPLYFFHFSGYSPLVPQRLSKHQTRHNLLALPVLRKLTDFYAQTLLAAGFFDSSVWPYAFETLPNGVSLPLELVNAMMQWSIRNGIQPPCPLTEADDFCRFAMSRSMIPGKPNVTFLYHFLLELRGDVVSAFPNSRNDSDDPGFREWLKSSGLREYSLRDLVKFEPTKPVVGEVTRLFQALRRNADQGDKKLRSLWSVTDTSAAGRPGPPERAAKTDKSRIEFEEMSARYAPAVGRILSVYFLRGDLQVRFAHFSTEQQVEEFRAWLVSHRSELLLTREEIAFFAEYAKAHGELLEQMRLLYFHRGRRDKTTLSIYDVDRRRYEIDSRLSTARAVEFLLNSPEFEPVDHYLQFATGPVTPAAAEAVEPALPGMDARAQFLFKRTIQEGLSRRRDAGLVVNCAGYLSAPSGMGESARSMLRTLAETRSLVKAVSLPHVLGEFAELPASPFMFGWPASQADVAIMVANADAYESGASFLPQQFWAKRNIGYWVWETEELPYRYKNSESKFAEIWTPSLYSAAAIRKTVSVPVRVLPHVIDVHGLVDRGAGKSELGLPDSAIVFGFMFDTASGLQRKNVEGLVRAFNDAFRKDDQCYLVLKVNGLTSGNFDYEMLRARTRNERVLFIEKRLSRQDVNGLLGSLDAYVSLHRAEGFGLTCAEAMALGVPVIASNYSGNLDFMTPDSSILVATDATITDRPYGPYPAGTTWGDPDHDAAVAALRSLLDGEKRRFIGRAGKDQVRAVLSPKVVAKHLCNLLIPPAG